MNFFSPNRLEKISEMIAFPCEEKALDGFLDNCLVCSIGEHLFAVDELGYLRVTDERCIAKISEFAGQLDDFPQPFIKRMSKVMTPGYGPWIELVAEGTITLFSEKLQLCLFSYKFNHRDKSIVVDANLVARVAYLTQRSPEYWTAWRWGLYGPRHQDGVVVWPDGNDLPPSTIPAMEPNICFD